MKTILVADDHKNIREYCGSALVEDGYRVLLACDGIEAIEIFIAESPDLVVLDVSMPRASGLEALAWIKRLSPQIPVILFTALFEDCMLDERTLLAAACVAKGKDLADLKRIISHLLYGRISAGEAELLRKG